MLNGSQRATFFFPGGLIKSGSTNFLATCLVRKWSLATQFAKIMQFQSIPGLSLSTIGFRHQLQCCQTPYIPSYPPFSQEKTWVHQRKQDKNRQAPRPPKMQYSLFGWMLWKQDHMIGRTIFKDISTKIAIMSSGEYKHHWWGTICTWNCCYFGDPLNI